MSNLPGSPNKVQTESVLFRRAVSEASVQSIAALANHLRENLLPVGTIVSSMLTEAQYQAQTTTGWVLCDGSSCVGTAYNALTGYTNRPDMRGTYQRMRDYGVGRDAAGDQLPGTYTPDAFASHVHSYTRGRSQFDPTTNQGYNMSSVGTADPGQAFDVTTNSFFKPFGAGDNTDPAGSAETRVKTVTVNFFIRVD